jgi:hypothetical protein
MKRSMPRRVSLSADEADLLSYRSRQLGVIQSIIEEITSELALTTFSALNTQRATRAALQVQQRTHTGGAQQIAVACAALAAELAHLIPRWCAPTKEVVL